MREGSDWNHYTYVYGEGRQARVDFDLEAAVLPTDDSLQGLRVRWEEGSVDRTCILQVLGSVDAWLVGRMAYAGQQELVLQLPGDHDPTSLLTRLRELGTTAELTKGWDYFDDRIAPTPQDWRRIQDREALERLDLDGDGELRVLHRLVGSPAALDRIVERLVAEGFEEVAREGEHLTLAHLHPIHDISRITLGLMRLCEPLGIAYDGWVLPG